MQNLKIKEKKTRASRRVSWSSSFLVLSIFHTRSRPRSIGLAALLLLPSPLFFFLFRLGVDWLSPPFLFLPYSNLSGFFKFKRIFQMQRNL